MTTLGDQVSVVAEALDCSILDSTIRIEGLPPAVRGRMAELLRPFVVPSAEAAGEPLMRLRAVRRGRGDWIVRAEESAPDVRSDLDGGGRINHLLASLEWRAVGDALAASTGYAVVHAAALTRGANTVLLLGRSGAGKTTLTLGLMGRGWEPFTDDMTLIDTASLEVHTFPRCFHIEGATLAALAVRPQIEQSTSLPTYWHPLHWAEHPRRPTMIVLVERNPERPTRLLPTFQAEGAGAILDATIRNQVSGSELARVAACVAAQASGAWSLNNMALRDALDAIEAQCAK
jgi:hypothetical protein